MVRAQVPVPALPALGIFLAALFAAVYPSNLVWLWGRWQTDPFYSHGPLIPLVSLALLWSRRRELVFAPRLSAAGLGLLAGAAILHLVGSRLMAELLSSVSLVVALAGAAHLAGGAPLLREAAFPLLYLLFAIPLPRAVLEKVSLPLQLFSSVCAEGVFRGLGCAASRQGVLLIFPGFTLAVADACSGLRSLITVLAIGTLAAKLAPASLARKLAIVGLGAVAALLANILRITLAGLIGLAFDGPAGSVFFERYSGYVFFPLVILAVMALCGLLKQELPAPAPAPAPAAPLPAPSGKLLFRLVFLPLCLLLLPAAGLARKIEGKRTFASPQRFAAWTPELRGAAIVQTTRRPAFPGEEMLTGVLESDGGRALSFTLLHSVSGRYLHSPEACSLATGWILERQDLRELGGLPVQIWILRRGPERVCLLFWFDLGGRPVRGSLSQHFGAVWQRLWKGQIDSLYGEIAFPLPLGASLADEAALLELSASLHRSASARLWR